MTNRDKCVVFHGYECRGLTMDYKACDRFPV